MYVRTIVYTLQLTCTAPVHWKPIGEVSKASINVVQRNELHVRRASATSLSGVCTFTANSTAVCVQAKIEVTRITEPYFKFRVYSYGIYSWILDACHSNYA